jgi:hypothetical protein
LLWNEHRLLFASITASPSRKARMENVTLPEQYSERIEMIAGSPIRVTSYRLWDTFYAKAEVALGGWFAGPEGSTKAGVEGSVIAEAEWLLAKRR